jgi:membrane protease YdiL (CAAX protease family)
MKRDSVLSDPPAFERFDDEDERNSDLAKSPEEYIDD